MEESYWLPEWFEFYNTVCLDHERSRSDFIRTEFQERQKTVPEKMTRLEVILDVNLTTIKKILWSGPNFAKVTSYSGGLMFTKRFLTITEDRAVWRGSPKISFIGIRKCFELWRFPRNQSNSFGNSVFQYIPKHNPVLTLNLFENDQKSVRLKREIISGNNLLENIAFQSTETKENQWKVVGRNSNIFQLILRKIPRKVFFW